jgi:hypothetical protein
MGWGLAVAIVKITTRNCNRVGRALTTQPRAYFIARMHDTVQRFPFAVFILR